MPSSLKRFCQFLGSFFIAFLLSYGTGMARSERPPTESPLAFRQAALRIINDVGENVDFTVEVADTDALRELGLMFRRELPENRGMLLIYSAPEPIGIWMKNTLLPLDILFFDAEGRITHLHHNAVPGDLTPMMADGLSLGVLEINAGLADRLKIGEKSRVIYPVSR